MTAEQMVQVIACVACLRTQAWSSNARTDTGRPSFVIAEAMRDLFPALEDDRELYKAVHAGVYRWMYNTEPPWRAPV